MKALLVEDSEKLQRAVRLALRKSGYAVDATGDGEEGLWLAESNDYDVMILDLMLPGRDGLSVLRRLRETGRQPPVLLLTAKNTVEERVAGLRSGADDYLGKPFAMDELLARVGALVRRKYESRSPVVRLVDLEVDTVARSVSRSGVAIDLTAREYRLLEFLARRAGQVTTRTEIEEHLYGDGTEIFSNAVESTVSTLRRKLARPGGGLLIHTRRGLGYVLAADDSCAPSANG